MISDRLIAAPQYTLPQAEKTALLEEELRRLTGIHRVQCEAYRRVVDNGYKNSSEIPFIPVRLFKSLRLQSVPDNEALKILTSSGTTSQQVSRIVLDRETATLQTKALASIITSFIGPKRLPMIIIDSSSTLKDPKSMSARGAGLVGLSNFGHDHFYALDSEMRLDLSGLQEFLARHRGERILIFGFTYMVWQYFYSQLRAANLNLSIENGILIHSGGWKKLQDQAVSNDLFKSALLEQTGLTRIHNFYGMVEQVGGIYMECDRGYFHAPNMADVLMRDPGDWAALSAGKPGLIQTLSVLPRSYPGHSLLTEDVGVIHGWDDCDCGRKGVRFTVQGRMERAELRGCSDTHAFSKSGGLSGPMLQFIPDRRNAASIQDICDENFVQRRPLSAFAPLIVQFLDLISAEILRSGAIKEYPELTALAFWLRKANITSIISGFTQTASPTEKVQPVGTVLHIAPSNVDTIFLYSWALSLLSGNLNIVRISQTLNPQLELLLGVIQRTLADPQFEEVRSRNIVLTYPHDEEVTRFLSSHADARLIWGGDQTVNLIRAIPSKPTTREISFADKMSMCVVASDQYLKASHAERSASARAFYNDAYQFDQLACSSPHFVIFVGTAADAEQASSLFWNAVVDEIRRRGRIEHASTQMDKLVATAELIASDSKARLLMDGTSSRPVAIRLPIESVATARIRYGGGFFVESIIGSLAELAQIIQAGDQTLTYLGFSSDEMRTAADTLCSRGVDRIVPVGQALNFSPVWDGYVLLAELTRRVTVL